MSKRPASLFIGDILEAILKIERYTDHLTRETFAADDKTVDAVVRNLEIIGEAANRLSADVKARKPEVEWSKIVGLRHRIVHDYFGIDLDIVWRILRDDLRELKAAVRSLHGGEELTN